MSRGARCRQFHTITAVVINRYSGQLVILSSTARSHYTTLVSRVPRIVSATVVGRLITGPGQGVTTTLTTNS